MRTAAILAAALLCLSGCAADPVNSDYRGPDAGVLVYSMGTVEYPSNYDFRYRKSGGGRDSRFSAGSDGDMRCSCLGWFNTTMSDSDYTGREVGKVHIQYMPPGNYEVYAYDFVISSPLDSTADFVGPEKDFSLPFTIKPGRATYIGNFARVRSQGTRLHAKLGVTGYFVISDKHKRDIAIARKQDSGLPPVTISVTNVSRLGQKALLAKELK